eukprot:5077939-Karenia_brevis.AAC.1
MAMMMMIMVMMMVMMMMSTCRNAAYITQNSIQHAEILRILRRIRCKMPKYSVHYAKFNPRC